MSSHALLQQIFPTQESNWGLPHCGQILYQLSYQGSHVCIYVGYSNYFAESGEAFHELGGCQHLGLLSWHAMLGSVMFQDCHGTGGWVI